MRSRDRVIRDFVEGWLHKAEADLAAAEILAASEMPDYSTCIFHCQQAAEKFIKAYLVRHQIEFPKTHELGQLLKLASQAEPGLPEELSSCEWLTPFGVEFHYPDIPSEVFLTPEDGLQTHCVANFDNIQTVPKNRVGPLITYLSSERMAEVNRAIAFALGLDAPVFWS